jgi:cobalt/nickel transport system ATP-binding protein
LASGSPTVAALRLSEVSFTYPQGTAGLREVSFEVGSGEAVGIVGPNGAGKSTLALLLLGFLLPEQGRIDMGELRVERRSLVDVRRRVGLVFENPDDQLFLSTVLEDVAFGLLNQGLPPAEAKERSLAALGRVGLEHAAERFPGHLSSGQKRAAAIATVLALEPEVVVLDEPTANLDPRARRRVIELVRALPGTRLVISHDLEMVLDCCARVLLLDQGRLVADGAANELLADGPLLDAHGLEKPHSLMTASEHAHVHAERHAARAR